MLMLVEAGIGLAIILLIWWVDRQPEEELLKPKWHALVGLIYILMLTAALIGLFSLAGVPVWPQST